MPNRLFIQTILHSFLNAHYVALFLPKGSGIFFFFISALWEAPHGGGLNEYTSVFAENKKCSSIARYSYPTPKLYVASKTKTDFLEAF